MKKLSIYIVCLFTLISCAKHGEVVNEPKDLFQYNGKIYKAFQIGVGNGQLIWVVLPKDSSSDEEPISIQYGKNESITIIK